MDIHHYCESENGEVDLRIIARHPPIHRFLVRRISKDLIAPEVFKGAQDGVPSCCTTPVDYLKCVGADDWMGVDYTNFGCYMRPEGPWQQFCSC